MQEKAIPIAFVGHVDHGKSSILGRLLVETNSLPEGKLEEIKSYCERNAKHFEYAYLTDALEKEQSQGITIDSARYFIRAEGKKFVFIDTPGHLDFLKNMITGSAAAEIALLTVDAKEGIQENTLRHVFLLSFLHIRQVLVLINKMDQVAYSKEAFEETREKILQAFSHYGLFPSAILPLSAKQGDLFTQKSERMPWHQGPTLWQSLLSLSSKAAKPREMLRLPLQDIYRFSEKGDERRIYAGTVASGVLKKGDRIFFSPSQKEAIVHSIEHSDRGKAETGEAIGFTLASPLFVERGELISQREERPLLGTKIKATLFWMSETPIFQGLCASLRIHTAKVSCFIEKILSSTDTSTLEKKSNKLPARFDIVECILSLEKPIAFDLDPRLIETNRFVLTGSYEMLAAGKILENLSEEKTTRRICLLTVSPEQEERLKSEYPDALFASLTQNKSLEQALKELER